MALFAYNVLVIRRFRGIVPTGKVTLDGHTLLPNHFLSTESGGEKMRVTKSPWLIGQCPPSLTRNALETYNAPSKKSKKTPRSFFSALRPVSCRPEGRIGRASENSVGQPVFRAENGPLLEGVRSPGDRWMTRECCRCARSRH